ncbi:MAG: amidohydrolase family protein, partial [Ignisphaera sp.]
VAGLLGGDVVDLNGATVLPGFIDSHIHLDELGLQLGMLDLRGVKSIRELKERLKEFSKSVDTLWIIGFGWDQELFEERRWPTRWDLDEVVSNRPVILYRICMHVAVLNSRGLELASVSTIESPNVVRDDRGVPTGIVREDALNTVREKIEDSISVEDYKKILLRALNHLASQGVTTAGFVGCDPKVLKALTELWKEKQLPIRVRVYLDFRKSWSFIDVARDVGLRSGFGDEYLKIVGVKLYADGSLGARTAWLSKPYSDDPSTSGYPATDPRDLRAAARKIHESGLQLAIHGIGDRAIDVILDIYQELPNARMYRHRIEHASVLREDQIDRMARLGVAASVQPNFVISDWWALQRLGEERIKWLYPFKTMIEKGIPVGIGTDSPVEPANPWQTIYAAVTRGKYENVKHYRYTESQSLTVEEALHHYTYGSAYILLEEEDLGTLEPGKLADFIIVDRDPLKTDERELKNIKVLATYIGGKPVWRKQ